MLFFCDAILKKPSASGGVAPRPLSGALPLEPTRGLLQPPDPRISFLLFHFSPVPCLSVYMRSLHEKSVCPYLLLFQCSLSSITMEHVLLIALINITWLNSAVILKAVFQVVADRDFDFKSNLKKNWDHFIFVIKQILSLWQVSPFIHLKPWRTGSWTTTQSWWANHVLRTLVVLFSSFLPSWYVVVWPAP